MAKLTIVEGIGPVYEKKLKEAGITSIESLLKTCETKKARTELAKKADISEDNILTWVNHADLMRIKGIGGNTPSFLRLQELIQFPSFQRETVTTFSKRSLKLMVKRSLFESFQRKSRYSIG